MCRVTDAVHMEYSSMDLSNEIIKIKKEISSTEELIRNNEWNHFDYKSNGINISQYQEMARDELSKDRSENGVKSLMKTYEDDIKLFYENDISI